MIGFQPPPYVMGPVECNSDNQMFIRCVIEQDGGRIEWIVFPSLGKGGEIWCSGFMGIDGISKRQAKKLAARYQSNVYRHCAQRFRRKIRKVELLLVHEGAQA